MADVPPHGPYMIERCAAADDSWLPVEDSWEFHNRLPNVRDARRVARQLALIADGTAAYRVVASNRQVISDYLVSKSLSITTGAQVRAVPLPAGFVPSSLSDFPEHGYGVVGRV